MHALVWSLAAWAAWLWLAIVADSYSAYGATSLTAAAGVAVLGARRPGVDAWNAVVAGLVATLCLPLAQTFLVGNSWLHSDIWSAFRAVLMAVVILNFAASRAALGAVALIVACFFAIIGDDDHRHYFQIAVFFAGISPWLAWLPFVWRKSPADECERLIRDFRDRFGLMWLLRVQEQFNHAAKNSQLPLEWNSRGLRRLGDGCRTKPNAPPLTRFLWR